MLRLFQLELPLFRRAAPPAEQTRHIQLGTRIVDYRLIRSSRRTLGMTIDQRGLRVGASPRTSLADIERFLRHNAAWVLKKLDEWHGHGQARHLAICDGASIPVLGEECVVRIEPGVNRVRWVGHTLILQARPDADLRQLARRGLRTRALEVFKERAAHYAAPHTSYLVVINKAGKMVYTGVGGSQDVEAALAPLGLGGGKAMMGGQHE